MSRTPSRFQYDPTTLNMDSSLDESHSEILSAQTGEALQASLNDPQLAAASEPFVGRWESLISTTNWEKGKIILQWRTACKDSGVPSIACSDEAWARRVGSLTSQHVGRLRRVSERFADSYPSYQGLHWSHFLAALDWDDAEMWLEGAVQSRWSVSQMRRTRWETLGADPSRIPSDSEMVAVEVDDGFTPFSEDKTETNRESLDRISASGPSHEGPDFGDADDAYAGGDTTVESGSFDPSDANLNEPLVSPFSTLPILPTDVAEVLEEFKLAIVRHRMAEWSEISQVDMRKVVEALVLFVMARSE